MTDKKSYLKDLRDGSVKISLMVNKNYIKMEIRCFIY